MRDGLLRDVLHHAHADRVVELVHVQRVVGGLARMPRSSTSTLCACAREFLGHGETAPAAADDGDVHGLQIRHGHIQWFTFNGSHSNGFIQSTHR